MRTYLIFLSNFYCIFLLFSCTHAAPVKTIEEAFRAHEAGKLLAIDATLIAPLIKENKPLIVEFTADWCVVCRKIKGRMEKLAKRGKGQYIVATVDITDRDDLKKEWSVEGLPSFRLYYPGIQGPLEGEGTGTLQAIENIMRDRPKAAKIFPVRTEAFPSSIKAVLVAGSSSSANFAEEIYLNFIWLIERGFKAEEIACFYARPDLLEYYEDQAQFDTLATFLKSCAPATKTRILSTISTALAKPESKDVFYFYASSHGNKADKSIEPGKDCASIEHLLLLDEEISGSVPLPKCLNDAGLRAADLAASLGQEKSRDIPKIIVIQSCYSGGFISATGDPSQAPGPLLNVPASNILTASRADRPSFGCHPGPRLTYYGRSYLTAASSQNVPLQEIDWESLSREVAEGVNQFERRMGISKSERSEPQYFKTKP